MAGYTDQDAETLLRMARDGYSLEEMSQATGHSITGIRGKLQRSGFKGHLRTKRAAPEPQPQPAAPTVGQQFKAEVEAMQRAAVEGGYDDDEPPELVWKREEEKAARKIRKAAEAGVFRWHAPGPHLLLSFVSDQHIAPGTPVDFKAMREDAELIRATPHCYAILGGDGIDNHIKHRAAVMAARSQPEDQYQLFEYYLRILADKSLLMVSGNHENWTTAFAGVDMLGRVARDQRLCYAPDEAFLEISVGTQTYRVAVRHQFRMNSSFNQTHAVKQWLRLGEREFDIGCIGHHHEHAVEAFVYRGKVCWGCRPGSYQITSAYSRAYGYNASIPTTPTFMIRGDRREITGFSTLRAALDFVRAAREIGIAA